MQQRFDAIRRATLTAVLISAFGASGAQAQATDRPLRIILPVGPGSGVDSITRTMAPALARALGGQAVVVENQPGAGGIPGTHAMIKSPPDGQTISVVANSHVIYPSVYKNLPFDPIADITPISVIGSTPMVVLVNPSKVPARSVGELVAFLKARPGAYNYASSGNGTILHLASEMFVDLAGADVRHIPYKGVAPMLADTIGGQVEMTVSSLPTVQGHIRSGALRAIGIGSAARVPAAPDIPTVAEQGMPDYLVEGWFAAVGPARLPAEQVRRLHAAFVAAFAAPEVREAMAKQGNVINPTTPEAAAQYFRSELAKYARLVQKSGVKLD
ncbi:MAG: tripartite tricarboxylate transporter substrate binding protein [Burkholderiales bacterium]|nr:tripartite tricarboxylate transporter substrate binding protein [Burkholderiales bacterium]